MPAAAPAPSFRRIAQDDIGIPLYRVVMQRLLGAVESGALAPGATLPSEQVLASQFGISIGTLRQAVGELVAEHILVRRQGRGTFVAHHNAERFLFQFFHVERTDGLRELPQIELLSVERIRIDDDEAVEALAVRPGIAGIQIENRLSLQGRPVIHDRLLLPAALYRGLTEQRLARRGGTIYQFYQSEFGITVVRAHERARAVGADRSNARVLGLSLGAPVLQVRRTALTFGDKPVEYRVSTLNTAMHDYVSVRSRPS